MASMKPKKSSLPPPKPRAAVTVGAARSNKGPIVIGAIVAVVLIIGIAVVLLTGGDDGDDVTTPTGPPVPVNEIFRPVAVEGDALAPFTEEMIEGDEADPAVGELAPIVAGEDYEGNPVTIDAARDGPTMVVLLAHWCPHCNAEIPRLNEWRDSGDVPDDLNVVGVSTGIDPSRPNYPPDQWLAAKDWHWTVLADSDLAADDDPAATTSAFRAYGGQYFPTAIVIGSDGRVLLRFSGEPSADEIDELITRALAEDTPG